MEFSGQYLTFTEYKGLGGTLAEMPFNLLEFESRRLVDIRTQNRLKEVKNEDIPQEVKLCIFDLIDAIDSYVVSISSAKGDSNIASESIDGYSVSYVKSTQIKEIIQSRSAEMDDIIETYLLQVVFDGTHLMYLGV